MLNWAQVVATKTSGDFGIEALISGKPVIGLGEWGKHEGFIRQIIEDYEGLIKIKDFRSAGQVLNNLYRTNLLYLRVKQLWKRLDDNPPFDPNWAENVVKYLELCIHNRVV